MDKDETPIWHRPEWNGPPVERRPAQAGPEWPEGAIERVTFRKEDYPDVAFAERLPQTLYFGADGWPLITPEAAKPDLDPRCKALLRHHPCVLRPENWTTDIWVDAFRDFDQEVWLDAQVGISDLLSRLLHLD